MMKRLCSISTSFTNRENPLMSGIKSKPLLLLLRHTRQSSFPGAKQIKTVHNRRHDTTRPAYPRRYPCHLQQHLQSTRRNPLPVKRIDGSLLMCHKHLACALVEQMESGKTSSGPDGILHHAPEAFDRIEVMATMGR